MRKLLSLLVCLVLVFGLVGCGNGDQKFNITEKKFISKLAEKTDFELNGESSEEGETRVTTYTLTAVAPHTILSIKAYRSTDRIISINLSSDVWNGTYDYIFKLFANEIASILGHKEQSEFTKKYELESIDKSLDIEKEEKNFYVIRVNMDNKQLITFSPTAFDI